MTHEIADELVDRAEINNGSVLVEYSRTEAALSELRKRYTGAAFDLATTAGDKAARAARMELVKLRTGLESKRKELKGPAVEFGRKIDDEAKRIAAEILSLETPIDAQIKADEKRREDERLERERIAAERVAGFRARIKSITDCVTKAQGLPSVRIDAGIQLLIAIKADDGTWEEFADEAKHAQVQAIEAMQAMCAAAIAREAEVAAVEAQRIENARIAAEQAAAAAAIAEQQRAHAAQVAEQAAKLAAEQAAAARKMADMQRAMDEQAAAIAAQQKALDDAKEAAERAERDKVEAEARRVAEDAARLIREAEEAVAAAELAARPAPVAARRAVARRVAPAPALTLEQINARLGFTMTAEFLAGLGFEGNYFLESEFPAICSGVSAHVLACSVAETVTA